MLEFWLDRESEWDSDVRLEWEWEYLWKLGCWSGFEWEWKCLMGNNRLCNYQIYYYQRLLCILHNLERQLFDLDDKTLAPVDLLSSSYRCLD